MSSKKQETGSERSTCGGAGDNQETGSKEPGENQFARFCPQWHVCVFAAIITISMITFCRSGAGQMSNLSDQRPGSLEIVKAAEQVPERPSDSPRPDPANDVTPTSDIRHPASVNDQNEAGSSALWRRSIWESLPTEYLKGPDPDPVSEAYQKNEWKPIFIDPKFRLNQTAAQLLARLRTLESDAIDPRPFRLDELSQSIEKLDQSRSALRTAAAIKDSRAESLPDRRPSALTTAAYANQSAEPAPSTGANSTADQKRYLETFQAASEADIRLTTAFFLFAREMNPFSQTEETMKALSGEIPFAEFLKDLEPKTFNYEALVSAYAKYKNLAAQGTQQRVNFPSKVRQGESGNHIRELQKRLQQEDFYSGNITGVYDAETQRAVKDFQAAHLLDSDGSVGQRTKEWLNVSFKQKADLIAHALTAVRQSPSRAHSTFIRINIPQFMLEYYKDGQFQEAHRIVVGKASGKKVNFRSKMVGENQTPTLASSIEHIILNPRWYVSDRIRLELDAQAKSDPEWFAKHGYVSMSTRYPWGAPRIFQSPGPKNALGRVKFEFANPYAVYLHDTPLKHLFARSRRDFSHGCIRVDKAIELAERLLRDDSNPSADKMKSVMQGPGQHFVKLSQPLPISIEYIPVVVAAADGSAHVVFAGDPYGVL